MAAATAAAASTARSLDDLAARVLAVFVLMLGVLALYVLTVAWIYWSRLRLADEVIDFASAERARDPALQSSDLAELIASRFGVRMAPDSIERAVAQRQGTRSGP